MEITMWIYTTALTALVALVLAVYIVSRFKQSRIPIDERYERIRKELLQSESTTGSTSILSGTQVGVSDENIKDLADGLGFDWSGYSGRNNRRLNFQRRLPG